MTSDQHDHARPGITDMRAALGTARAVLGADPDAAHEAAGAGSCPACTVVSAVQFGFALAASLTGQEFVTGQLLARLLAAVDAAQRELDTGSN